VRVGEPELARLRLREALALLGQLETPREAVFLLEALGEWLCAVGRPADTARMLAAAAAMRGTMNMPFMPHEAQEVGSLAARARQAIGEGEWALQQAAGGQLAATEALAQGNVLTNPVR
jgi:hypothetical protein